MPPTLHPHLPYIPSSLYKHYPLLTIQGKKSTHPNFIFILHTQETGPNQKRTKERNEPSVTEKTHAWICSKFTPKHLDTWELTPSRRQMGTTYSSTEGMRMLGNVTPVEFPHIT